MCWVLKREFVRAFILACKSDLKSNPGSHTHQGTLVRRADGARASTQHTDTPHTHANTTFHYANTVRAPPLAGGR